MILPKEFAKKVHEKRDKFTYKGIYLTTVDLSIEMARAFFVPPNPASLAAISPILTSPHRRLVRTVVREVPLPSFTTTVPDTEGLTDAPPWLGELMSSVREMRGLLTDQMVTRD